MTNVVLCRVDSRLIHGQVMTKWIQQAQANRIVIISDTVSKDLFLLDIYKMSAPPGIEIDCYSEVDAVKKWDEDTIKGKVLLLLPDLKTVDSITKAGISIAKIQIGGLGGGPKRKVIYQNITLDDEDVQVLQSLDQKGVEIIFQTIPEDTPLRFADAYAKFIK